MKLDQARKILKKHCHHHEEWRCGRATIRLSARDPQPRFDRHFELFLSLPTFSIDTRKVAALLKLLNRLCKN